MSILYSDEQLAIGTESRRAIESAMASADQLGLLETQGQYHTGFWTMAVAQGWCALAIPEAFGGLDLGLLELGLIAQAAGRSVSGAPFLTSSYGVAAAIMASTHPALHDEWLPQLATGDAIGAIAFAEDGSACPNRPALSFAGGTLSGVKPAVSGGAHAHVAAVLASDHGTPVLVIASLAGVGRHVFNTFDNSRCTADLTFVDTPAIEIARGDAAIAAAIDVLARQAVVSAHEQMGGAEALLERGRDYANTRKAFGQPIGAFQSVKHRLAELYGLVEIARANAIHAAARVGKPDFLRAAAAARISATEAYDTAARDVVQVHGGIGVTWDAGLHLHMRRARTLAIEQGNLLFWEDILVNELTGEAV